MQLGQGYGQRLGTAEQYVGKKAESLAAYKRAVELDPKNVDYRTTYGLILGVNGQANAGVEELKKVVATPGYADSAGYVNLGWLYRNTDPKRPEDSIAAYKKGLELNPKEEQAALGMGWAYINMKNWDPAIAAFNQAVQIDPTTAPEANNAIGWSYLFKKDAAKAREYYDKGSAAGRADPKLKLNIERLEKNEAIEDAKIDQPPPPPRMERPDVGTVSQRSGRATWRYAPGRPRDLATYGAEGVSALINAVKTTRTGAFARPRPIASGHRPQERGHSHDDVPHGPGRGVNTGLVKPQGDGGEHERGLSKARATRS